MELMKEYLRKQREEVSTSKEAAKKLLTGLGLLPLKGRLNKNFKPRKVKP